MDTALLWITHIFLHVMSFFEPINPSKNFFCLLCCVEWLLIGFASPQPLECNLNRLGFQKKGKEWGWPVHLPGNQLAQQTSLYQLLKDTSSGWTNYEERDWFQGGQAWCHDRFWGVKFRLNFNPHSFGQAIWRQKSRRISGPEGTKNNIRFI